MGAALYAPGDHGKASKNTVLTRQMANYKLSKVNKNTPPKSYIEYETFPESSHMDRSGHKPTATENLYSSYEEAKNYISPIYRSLYDAAASLPHYTPTIHQPPVSDHKYYPISWAYNKAHDTAAHIYNDPVLSKVVPATIGTLALGNLYNRVIPHAQQGGRIKNKKKKMFLHI